MSEEVKAPRPPKRAPKKKVCTFCVEHAETIDYKDAAKLRRFTTETASSTQRPSTIRMPPSSAVSPPKKARSSPAG